MKMLLLFNYKSSFFVFLTYKVKMKRNFVWRKFEEGLCGAHPIDG